MNSKHRFRIFIFIIVLVLTGLRMISLCQLIFGNENYKYDYCSKVSRITYGKLADIKGLEYDKFIITAKYKDYDCFYYVKQKIIKINTVEGNTGCVVDRKRNKKYFCELGDDNDIEKNLEDIINHVDGEIIKINKAVHNFSNKAIVVELVFLTIDILLIRCMVKKEYVNSKESSIIEHIKYRINEIMGLILLIPVMSFVLIFGIQSGKQAVCLYFIGLLLPEYILLLIIMIVLYRKKARKYRIKV